MKWPRDPMLPLFFIAVAGTAFLTLRGAAVKREQRSASIAPPPANDALLTSEFLDPDKRKAPILPDLAFLNQDGMPLTFAELSGTPSAIAFFYVGCTNPNRCASTVAGMRETMRKLAAEGLEGDVNLLLITFEPENDTPSQLKSYGDAVGIQFGGDLMMLQGDPERLPELLNALEVPVNYSGGTVNTHGVTLYLLDRQGRLARKYHATPWSNTSVIDDLRVLAAERNTKTYSLK